jgi:hypothetical protein
VGDLLNIRGFYKTQPSNWDRFGYRRHLGEGCTGFVRSDGGVLIIDLVDAGVSSQAVTAPPGFGAAQNGNARPNPELLSTSVFIPGPLTVTNASPTALTRISATGGVAGYNGFEVTGGILVNNLFTFGESRDGGPVRCDWRALAADGGRVTFPNGISGIWDTYTHAPCLGNPSCGPNRDAGTVPGTTSPNTFTHVLYPTVCSDLPGQVQ